MSSSRTLSTALQLHLTVGLISTIHSWQIEEGKGPKTQVWLGWLGGEMDGQRLQ